MSHAGRAPRPFGAVARVVLLVLLSTATAPFASAQEAPPAQVCVRRAAGASGWAVPLVLRQDGALLARFSVGQQTCFDLAPGVHELGALYWGKADQGSTRPAATRSLDLAPGDCRYFKVIMGFWGVLLRETDDRRFLPPARCAAPVGG